MILIRGKRLFVVVASLAMSVFVGVARSESAADEQALEPVTGVKSADAAPVQSWLTSFFGETLVKADGTEVAAESLAGKTIAIYFSAHWCPPCRAFTPVLVKTYNELVTAGKPFEIVFVSSDRSADAMFGYMKEKSMPWLALPFGHEQKRALSQKYGIRGIPSLVIIDSNGELITKNGRSDVSGKGASAFDGWQKSE